MLKIFYHALLSFWLSLGVGACQTSRIDGVPAAVASDPNDPVLRAVDNLTDHLFNSQQPTLTAAVGTLSPEMQALIQAAYVALDQVVDKAEASGVAQLTDRQHAAALQLVQNLAAIHDVLHATVHEPDARAPALIDGSALPLLPEPPVRP